MKAAFSQTVSADDEGRRLDRLLRIILKETALSALHKALRKGEIRVNGLRRKPDYRCLEGDRIEYSRGILPSTDSVPDSTGKHPVENSLSIVLETSDLLFINKPSGLLVHDGPGSLDAQVRAYLADRLEASLAFRPGPLHRLDRNTSGLITFSRSLAGAMAFSAALRRGAVRKTYLAIVEGRLESDECWRDSLSRDTELRRSFVDSSRTSPDKPVEATEAKEAITDIHPIASNGSITLAAIRLLTGRTHQIRAQGSHHGHPLLGDTKYGGTRCDQPYYLHAWKLSFDEQLFPDLPRELSAPFPPHFDKKILSSFSNPEKEVYLILRKFRFQEGT
ncbi:MAG: RluA family pseudouridine synthase [Spirochaetae bacterium HGW-Spirochaetae-9]|nr:MAG: RluA family pseudouridine synthase [Spirochaetae bacterium HGW-Spirochaetae-9]